MHEDGSDTVTVLTLHPNQAAAAGLATHATTITCHATTSGVAIVGSGRAHIDGSGILSPAGVTEITVRGVHDRAQLASRTEHVECSLVTTSGRSHVYDIPVTVHGNVEPSYRLFCPVAEGADPAAVAIESCSAQMTTNGNQTLVVIGGNCATCPQPPFDATTVVYVGGLALPTTLLPTFAGTRLVVQTPTIVELLHGADEATFEYTYYNFSIASFPDSALLPHTVGARVDVGPEAVHRVGNRLPCAERGHCPPASIGIYYTTICLGFVDVTNPTETRSWKSGNADEAALFAYGTPVTGCRACPTGCRCPGGDRCQPIEGYLLPCPAGDDAERCQDLEGIDEPILCHSDAFVAKRCAGWNGLRSACVAGSTGPLCDECATSWYKDNGVCRQCRSDEAAYAVIGYIALVFVTTFLGAFVLVAIVQGSYGNSIHTGMIRSLNFANWICSALATQAQIGRTSGGNQPALLKAWYRLLKLFEFNPDGARPTECNTGNVSNVSIIALSLGIALPTLFMVLALPCLQKLLVDVIAKIIASAVDAVTAMKSKKAAKKAAEMEGSVEMTSSSVIGPSEEHASIEGSVPANDVHVATMLDTARAPDHGTVRAKLARAIDDSAPKMTTNPLSPLMHGRDLAMQMRTDAQREEVELVMMNPMQRQATLTAAMKEIEISPQKSSFIREVMRVASPMRGGESKRPESSDSVTANDDGALIFDPMDLVVQNKRARLSNLFDVRRDTILGAWKLEKQLDAQFESAAEAEDDCHPGREKRAISDTVFILDLEDDTTVANDGDDGVVVDVPPKKLAKQTRCCQKKKKKRKRRKKPAKTARDYGELAVGTLRKALLAATVLLHPMIVNSAFKSIYCTPHPVAPHPLVVASNPGVQCFVGTHWIIFILSILAIIIEVIALPLFIIGALGGSAAWCARCKASAPSAAETSIVAPFGGVRSIIDTLEQEEAMEKFAEKYGGVGGGLCCRCVCCVDCLMRARRSFVKLHGKNSNRVRSLSYSAFTFNDYKPEFFFVRLLYVCGNTVIALCNGFLDPLLIFTMPAGMSAVEGTTLLVGMQTARFVICAVVTVAPIAVILALLPNKRESRWKMPLRVVFAVLSLGMLALNAFAWGVQKMGTTPPASIIVANNVLSYSVLAMSMLALLIMAAGFVLFVVFRAAKKERIEEDSFEAEVEAEELAVLARALVQQNQTQRAFTAWDAIVHPLRVKFKTTWSESGKPVPGSLREGLSIAGHKGQRSSFAKSLRLFREGNGVGALSVAQHHRKALPVTTPEETAERTARRQQRAEARDVRRQARLDARAAANRDHVDEATEAAAATVAVGRAARRRKSLSKQANDGDNDTFASSATAALTDEVATTEDQHGV